MISHVTLGTNDLARAAEFYEPVMAALGYPRVPFERSDPFIMWRRPGDDRPSWRWPGRSTVRRMRRAMARCWPCWRLTARASTSLMRVP